jgi:transcriptional regulator with XRE-family HTH domain
MTTKPKTTSPTALYLDRAVAFSELNQREIADKAGFPKPNIISMMKQGETKVPIDRIPALAEACGVNADEFVATAMKEYQPEVWKVLQGSLGTYLSPQEMDLVMTYRIASAEGEIEISREMSELLLMLFTVAGSKQSTPTGAI